MNILKSIRFKEWIDLLYNIAILFHAHNTCCFRKHLRIGIVLCLFLCLLDRILRHTVDTAKCCTHHNCDHTDCNDCNHDALDIHLVFLLWFLVITVPSILCLRSFLCFLLRFLHGKLRLLLILDFRTLTKCLRYGCTLDQRD